ncbi:hypothetical protein [Cohnella cellulosilytica]|uniref:Bla regulator protein blaR1 n=1 Tax=Cohnella cellulosilytica TaxID=986710 RepID=A0ABW2FGL8_9BACL
MRAKAVYLIVVMLIAGSWLANYGYYRYYRLPEPGFLRHYIETTYTPSVAFDLLYVANKDDLRKPTSVTAKGLEALLFYPVQVHQELSSHTIYILRGYFDVNRMSERSEEAEEPLRLNSVTVYYSDGTMSEENVGEIIVYRPVWPPETSKEPPVRMSMAGSSSDHGGRAVVSVNRQVTLTGLTSAWLEKLGDSFRYELKTAASETPQTSDASPPLELSEGQAVTLDYRFRMQGTSDALSVYNVQLRERYEEPGGDSYIYTVFANYTPYPTDAQMRAYVREIRGRKD